MTKPYIDLALIVPLAEELQSIKGVFQVTSENVEGVQYQATLDVGDDDLTVVAFLQDGMGKAAATRTADRIVQAYEVGVMAVVGIAGGLSDDVALGEVCFSTTIIDVLENSKVSDGQRGAGTKTQFNPEFHPTDRLLSFALRYLKIGEDVRSIYDEWRLECLYAAEKLVPGEFIGRKSKNEKVSLPDCHDGAIICGAVSKSEVYNSTLKDIDRKLLALETESGGPFRTASDAHIPAVAIRGVCDYADANKSKLEEQTSGAARHIASTNVARFLKAQIANPQFRGFLSKRRSDVLHGHTPELFTEEPTSTPLELARRHSEDETDRQLRDLAPDYAGKPKGYRLPIPRVKQAATNIGAAPALKPSEDPVSVLEAIVKERVSLIQAPRTYPDNSLPWLIAAEVALIQVDGRPTLPVVIKGDQLKPHHGILRCCAPEVSAVIKDDAISPIVIIDEAPLNARSRADFIADEIKEIPNARFVFVNKTEGDPTSSSDIILRVGAVRYVVTDISFYEMSNFIQRNFNMPDQEASVIALRLQDTFARFDLNAHPSYFAGVGGDALLSLLHANRRAELVQLAVLGFLSFAVVSDKTNAISRTFRERFLRRIIFEMRVNKKTYDHGSMMSLIRDISDDGDYGIEPLSFLKAFVDRGILHFDDGTLFVTLPFIESYLLADELARRPSDAKSYFTVSDDFDFATFDMYCELGPDPTVLADITNQLKFEIDTLLSEDNKPHILLTDEIRPSIIDNRRRLQNFEEQIKKAFEDVTLGRPNSKEKQRLLDVASNVEGRARIASNEVRIRSPEKHSELDRLHRGFRLWTAAIVGLGAASEHLEGPAKRQLAQQVIRATSILLDRWMRAFPRLEFEEFKDELLAGKGLAEIFDLEDGADLDATQKEFVRTIVDAYEFSLLTHPLRVMLQTVCDAAGQKVLAGSLLKVEEGTPMENIIAAVWSAEIDAAQTKPKLLKALRDLPPTPFLRFGLSQHFMLRVFWNSWQMADRMALLEAAEEAIKPIGGGKFDRHALRRIMKDTPSGGQ